MPNHVDVPEGALEALAVWHYNLTHHGGEKHGTPWVKASAAEKAKSLDQARYRLQAAAPAITAKAVEAERCDGSGLVLAADATPVDPSPEDCPGCRNCIGKRIDEAVEAERERVFSDEAIRRGERVLDDNREGEATGEARTDYALVKRIILAALDKEAEDA